jgi:colicin import membrane protein
MSKENTSTELMVNPEEFGITKEKSTELTSGLVIVKQERDVLIQEFNQVSKLEMTLENLEKFRELRIRIQKNRTQGINKWHKTNKEFFLTGGRFVDAIKNKEILINEQMEDHLMKGEKHFENLEIERLKALQEKRVELISKYVEDAEERDLSSMEEDVWNSFLSTKKQAYKDKIQEDLRIENERKAKEEAEIKERKRIAAENEKLKKEAEDREIQLEKERQERETAAIKTREKKDKRIAELQPYIVFIRDYNGLIEKSDSEYKKELDDIKKGAEQQWEFERTEQIRKQKEEDVREKKLKIEREKAAKIEAELKAKKDAEEKARLEEEERKQNELSKGDEEKKQSLMTELLSITTKYSFESKKNQDMFANTVDLIGKTVTYIKSK